MALIDELQQLSILHANGSLTEAEFIAAKQQLLQTPQQVDSTASKRLALEAELARIDREFTLEREECMMSGRYGHRSEPSRAMRVILPLFGLVWLGMGSFITTLFSKITNQMITTCRAYISRGTVQRLWELTHVEIIQRLKQCIALNAEYQLQFRRAKEKLKETPEERQFEFR